MRAENDNHDVKYEAFKAKLAAYLSPGGQQRYLERQKEKYKSISQREPNPCELTGKSLPLNVRHDDMGIIPTAEIEAYVEHDFKFFDDGLASSTGRDGGVIEFFAWRGARLYAAIVVDEISIYVDCYDPDAVSAADRGEYVIDDGDVIDFHVEWYKSEDTAEKAARDGSKLAHVSFYYSDENEFEAA